MKKLIVAVVALAVVAMAGKAMAAGSANLTVNATVLGSCTVSAAPTIALTLDPTSGLAGTGTGNIDFLCTNGTAYTLSGPVAGTMNSIASGANINYTLGYTNTVGAGTGATQTSVATVTVPYANYATAPAAVDYTSTVVVSILP